MTDMALCSRITASALALIGKISTSPYSIVVVVDAAVVITRASDCFADHDGQCFPNALSLLTNCRANFAPHRTLSSHPLHLNVPSVSSGWVPQPQLGNIPDAQSLVMVYVKAAELSAYTNDRSFVPIIRRNWYININFNLYFIVFTTEV